MLQVSCLPQRQAKVVEIKPVKVAEMTIIQGKTTKQEILDKLGAPRSFHNSVYTYWSPDNSMEYIDITYIEKDGTKWNFCIANRPECKEPSRNYSIVFMNFIGYSSISDSDKCVQMKPSYFWTNPNQSPLLGWGRLFVLDTSKCSTANLQIQSTIPL